MSQTPPTTPAPLGVPKPTGDATGGMIPYKNVAALAAYYAGVFAILPIFPIGFAALFLGIMGLRARAKNPVIRGAVHAWIGIIAGGLFGTLWLVLTILVFIKAL